MNIPKEFTLNIKVTIDNPQERESLHAVRSVMGKILAGQKRIEIKIMNFDTALDLLATNVGDLDASIQKEIADFAAIRLAQGSLTPAQQNRFDTLMATIVAQKAALDADDTPVTPDPENPA